MCAGMHVHSDCAGQPAPQTGFVSADMENTELQALPFCSSLMSVVKGQVSCGNWKADKWDSLREGLRALAAQTSQPLSLLLVSLRAEAVMCSDLAAVGMPYPNSPTLSFGLLISLLHNYQHVQ